jgi:uncharacterized protein (UPF0335 family)
MSNLNNLQSRLVMLSKQLANAKAQKIQDQELIENLEDQIADIKDEIEEIMDNEYSSKHFAEWR